MLFSFIYFFGLKNNCDNIHNITSFYDDIMYIVEVYLAFNQYRFNVDNIN